MNNNNYENKKASNCKNNSLQSNPESLGKYVNKLKDIKLFDGFSEEGLSVFLNSINNKILKLEKGDLVFSEGDEFSNLCILLEGEILLTNSDEYGNRNVIDIISENQMFAEVFSFTSKKQSPVTAQASSESLIFLIDTKDLISIKNDNKILVDKHIIVSNLLNIFADKNLILLSKIEVISRRNIRDKIMHFLELQRQKSAKNIFNIPYSRKDMADFLGVDRSALSRELSRLKEENIIDFEKNTFKII